MSRTTEEAALRTALWILAGASIAGVASPTGVAGELDMGCSSLAVLAAIMVVDSVLVARGCMVLSTARDSLMILEGGMVLSTVVVVRGSLRACETGASELKSFS